MSTRRAKVCIVQYRLLHYRVELFDRLRSACADHDIELLLVHGAPTKAERSRQDTGALPWAIEVRNVSTRIAGTDVLWQPLPPESRDCELIILMQESRLLSNYPWLFGWRRGGTRVAFWGHGRNLQSAAPAGWRERWKRWNLTKVDWWFAYTRLTRDVVLEAGYPAERVTVLNNAIDNAGFEGDLAAVSQETVAELRRKIDAAPGSIVGLYCGSLYPDKRLDLLLQACERVAEKRPDFRLVVIGDGPSRALLERASGRRWIHWAGALRGTAKAAWFRAAQLYLSPGAVGLHVLDSFVAGTPMVTTADALHGPEIVYLQDGVNGVVTRGSAQEYAQAIFALLDDPATLARLRAAALASAADYTLDAMVRNFVSGIQLCLERPRR